MNPTHMAKYLVLMQGNDAKRALLFNGEHRYLSELIDDDGLLIDNLVRFGTCCAAPADLSFEAVTPPPTPDFIGAQCYALG